MQFDDDPGCSPPNVVDSACATSSNGAASASAAPILLPMPYTYSKRQFDRSSSFTGLTRNIELSVRGGASGGSSSSGSDDSDDDAAPGDRARSGSGRGGAEASWAQPHGVFEVDEPSTEIKFVMRGLREALTKKETECEHLRQIIKELSISRARVQKNKVEMEESYAALQKEYLRVVKVSELARTVSQQSLSRSHTMRKELQAAHDAASRASRRGAAAADKARRLKAANCELRQRLAAVEALAARAGALDDIRTSASMREFLATAQAGLY
ncbi:hypothetical protein MNEG_5961 [Monoraphidium neglectum]|uniref:Uncharacterized protein n=1 Tax=Monoraphidium neglectum TaxID=145388 RepID=A0A0D2JSM0_9CHLO|nr:hypothetical protein MNEG_5961 [Monoraphidium neglectum]KIZ01998.1 hypothetical protein MNEG_5961 [Monoraphidium neglectum]|eukprot:XP_013901017.1 hypothetical protein MNEG_5961 [Monoraphidium neglectum]